MVTLNGDPLKTVDTRLALPLLSKIRPEDRVVVVKSTADTPYQHWINITSPIRMPAGITIQREEQRTEVVGCEISRKHEADVQVWPWGHRLQPVISLSFWPRPRMTAVKWQRPKRSWFSRTRRRVSASRLTQREDLSQWPGDRRDPTGGGDQDLLAGSPKENGPCS
jgi:hypothetical protein